MPVRLGSVLERARQSAAKMVVYVRNIVCSSQGYRENDSSQKDITRMGCYARVQLSEPYYSYRLQCSFVLN